MKSITTGELADKLRKNENIRIIDVREDYEVANGKIPGAIHIPLMELPEHLDQLNKNEHYYLVCHSGARSASACSYLEQAGFDVTNVEGGMMSWFGELEY